MSRSRKKVPMIKDNGKSHRYYKKQAHQTIRAKTRVLLGNSKPYEDLLFPTVKGNELVNAYDICDWKCSPIYTHSWKVDYTPENIRRYYRK